MATRLNRHHSELVLERIQLSNLVTRLQKHALRQLKDPNDPEKLLTMTDGEVRAAIFLIERKLAKAEAPRNLNVSGEINLIELIKEAGRGD
jgi:hypothetical protein